MTTHDSLPAPDPGNDDAGQWERFCRFLQAEAFVVLTHNAANAGGQEYEAWAYQGPLDFEFASPVRFGLGCDPTAAMRTLAAQLPDQAPPAATPAPSPPRRQTIECSCVSTAASWPLSWRPCVSIRMKTFRVVEPSPTRLSLTSPRTAERWCRWSSGKWDGFARG
jgi:hypothetical protein